MSENKLHTIIFSKDRALQLDSLLRSIRDNYSVLPKQISIIYKHSNSEYKKGYKILQSRNYIHNLNWIEEITFKENLKKCAQDLQNDTLVQFLVDDDIIFRQFNIDILSFFSDKDLTISLRVDRTYSRFPNPRFAHTSEYLKWPWYPLFKKRGLNFWYYPFSVDGNIFHSNDVKTLLNNIEFNAPNSLEGNMNRAKKTFLKKRFAIAPCESVLFNNPLNSVQSEGSTENEGLSVTKMNEQYLAGKIINNQKLYETIPKDVHFPVKLSFEKYVPR